MASASRFWRYARSPYAVATVAIGATSALGTSHGVFGANADPASEKPRTTTEPFTAIDFPHEKQCASGSDDSRCVLVGTAVRCMMGLCHWKVARAYAVGVYVEESNFLQQWEGAKDRAIASSAESEDELHKDIWYKLLETDAGASRELILVMDQDVKGEHIAHGFDRSLLTRVRKAQGGKKGPIKNALKDFTQIFKKQAMLRKGTQVKFIWLPEGVLRITIEDEIVGELACPELCAAVYDVYLGPKSVFAKYKNTAFSLVEEADSKADLAVVK
eukprot:CAMPEP_0114245744 /NCGR_PEP_ID=MMETSP0058-20121206/12070_1 /TAXON_ID=36894 /ORGANISM="Pyramimonas parkeae, CCMP726" /LENGTH=272 /DNA_ID=CAMNT_0001358839 /DNA_START=53 /DNA_END=871 /DNA_ORIENTATION=+